MKNVFFTTLFFCSAFLSFYNFSLAQTDQELLQVAIQFPKMPKESVDLIPFVDISNGITFGSGTPFNDLEYTILDTDYMEGETNGYNTFMPVNPSEEFPGSNKVKLVRGGNNLDLEEAYSGAKGDRIILGIDEIEVPFFSKGRDEIDNDYAVLQNIDFNFGHIQLRGTKNDYRLIYVTLTDGAKTEGWYLFYVKDATIDLIAFIFPCDVLGEAVSGRPPRNPTILCNQNKNLRLDNAAQFKFATPASSTPTLEKAIIQLGTTGKEIIGGITADKDKNTYLFGNTDGDIDGSGISENKIFVAKINTKGERVWTTALETKNGTLIFDAITDNTYLYAAGRTLGNLQGFRSGGRWDGILLKLNLQTGQIVNTNQFGNAGLDGYGNIVLDGEGNLYVSGQGSPTGVQGTDDSYLVAKHSTETLDNIWRVIEPPSANTVFVSEAWGGLSYLKDPTTGLGKLVVAGWYMTTGGSDSFISLYEDLNENQPTRTHTANIQSNVQQADWVLDNVMDKDGNIYAAGYTTGNLQDTQKGNGDAFIVKFSPSLTNPIYKQVGTEQSDQFRKLDVDKNGNLYAIGYTYGNYDAQNKDNSGFSGDIFIQKFDKDLNPLEKTQLGTKKEERGYMYLQDSILYVGGMTEASFTGQNAGSFDGFAFALKASDLSIYNIENPDESNDDDEITSTNDYFLQNSFQIFPNPTSSDIVLVNKISSKGSYQIYNSIGKVMENTTLKESRNLISLRTYSEGLYFIRVQTEKGITTFKIIKNE